MPDVIFWTVYIYFGFIYRTIVFSEFVGVQYFYPMPVIMLKISFIQLDYIWTPYGFWVLAVH